MPLENGYELLVGGNPEDWFVTVHRQSNDERIYHSEKEKFLPEALRFAAHKIQIDIQQLLSKKEVENGSSDESD